MRRATGAGAVLTVAVLLGVVPSGAATTVGGSAATAAGSAATAAGAAALPGVASRATASSSASSRTPMSTHGPTSARRPPVDGAVVRPFVAPPHEYGPGHRGVDLAAAAGAVVRSPAAGTVTFAGQVAGRGVVVVEHAGGTLTSLEPVSATLPRGSPVEAGSPVAVVAASPEHAGCAGGCVHWGVRVDGRYVDPLWWLGRVRAVRLLPMGSPV